MTSSRSCVGWTTVVTAVLLISGVISDTVETDGPSATYIQPVIEGDNLLVVCNTTAPVPDVYWTRNQTGSTFRQNGTELEFNDIQRMSSGDYLCHVINETDHDDVIVDVVTVDVHYPAKFNMSKTPRVVRENMQLDIVCTIEAHPPADMVLMSNTSDKVYFEGTHGTGIVDVGLVTAQWYMTGLYVCTGQNYLNHGINDTDTADVTVETRPIPDPYANMTYDEVAFLGKDVEFYLEYVGIPPPTSIKWEHDNKTLSPSHQHDVNGSSTLNVTNIAVPDYGEYVITLTNEIGSSQAKYNIQPKGGPQRPTDLEYFDVTYEAVTLRWKSGFDMGSRQHFTVWKQVGPNSYQTISPPIPDNSPTHGINQTWTHVQKRLASDTDYNLTVDADNLDEHYTSGLVKPPVRFRTLKAPKPKSGISSRTVALIVGPSVGAVVVIALLVFFLYLRSVKRRRIGSRLSGSRSKLYQTM